MQTAFVVLSSRQSWWNRNKGTFKTFLDIAFWCTLFPLICVWEEFVELIRYRVKGFGVADVWTCSAAVIILSLDIAAVVIFLNRYDRTALTVAAAVMLLPHLVIAAITTLATVVIASAECDEYED